MRTRLAAHEYPREIEYLPELPLTATGKIVRRDLRARAVDEYSSTVDPARKLSPSSAMIQPSHAGFGPVRALSPGEPEPQPPGRV